MNGSPLSTIVKKCTGRSVPAGSPSPAPEVSRRVGLPAVRVVISISAPSQSPSYEHQPYAGTSCTLDRMVTIFTIPKPFRGHVGEIQRNAIGSWRALRPDVQVVLVGNEEGVEKAARNAGVE